MQWRDLNADRNIGFSATVSARALNVDGSSLSGFFPHDGTRPQLIGTSSRQPSVRRTSIVVAGAMLYRECRIRAGPITSMKA
jgi:hypothetical protein